jgi:WD40 repeat protein
LTVAFSPDGKRLASGSRDGSICIWDTETRELVREPLKGNAGWVRSVAFSPDGQSLISYSDGGKEARIWDLDKPEDWHSVARKDRRACKLKVALFSPDGKTILTGSNEGQIFIGDRESLSTEETLNDGHQDAIRSIAFSPSGLLLATTGDDKALCIWDLESRKLLKKKARAHESPGNSVCWAETVIVTASDDMTMRLWDPDTLEQKGASLVGHGGAVHSVVITPNGKNIISASRDGTIRIWDLPPFEEATDAAFQAFRADCPYISPQAVVHDNGWVQGPDSGCLFWMPPYIKDRFPYPYLVGILGAHSMHQFDASRFVHGDAWVKCYRGS